jgi:hypothetical protein
MQHIAILRLKPEATEEAQTKHRQAEVRKIWDMTVSGTLRSINFFSGEGRGAVLHLETADLSEAQSIVRSLPMVEAGLLQAQILSLTPFTGLAALFAAPDAG